VVAEEEGFKSGMKERVGDGKLIIISITGLNKHTGKSCMHKITTADKNDKTL